MADPNDSDAKALPTTAGAFDKLPETSGPSLPLDGETAAPPADSSIEEAPTHIQEGVTVSSTMDDTPPERHDPYDRPERTDERTLKAAGAQLMPR